MCRYVLVTERVTLLVTQTNYSNLRAPVTWLVADKLRRITVFLRCGLRVVLPRCYMVVLPTCYVKVTCRVTVARVTFHVTFGDELRGPGRVTA